MAKGYRGRANSCYRTAINRVEKGLQYQYRDRKQKKRVGCRIAMIFLMVSTIVLLVSHQSSCIMIRYYVTGHALTVDPEN